MIERSEHVKFIVSLGLKHDKEQSTQSQTWETLVYRVDPSKPEYPCAVLVPKSREKWGHDKYKNGQDNNVKIFDSDYF